MGVWFRLDLSISKIEKWKIVLQLEKVGHSIGELIISALRLRNEEIIELTAGGGRNI